MVEVFRHSSKPIRGMPPIQTQISAKLKLNERAVMGREPCCAVRVYSEKIECKCWQVNHMYCSRACAHPTDAAQMLRGNTLMSRSQRPLPVLPLGLPSRRCAANARSKI